MIYFALARIVSLLLNLIAVVWHSEHEKDLELLLLCQQLRILQRKHPHLPRVSRWETLGQAVLTARLLSLSSTGRRRLAQVVFLFQPETLLTWHRDLVRRKWTCRYRRSTGRPPIAPELDVLILRLAEENPRWGYSKLQGELLKLGYAIGRSTVRDVLKRHRIPPAPHRPQRGSS